METSPPPFFKQGPSARARLAFFATLAIALLFIDARMGTLAVLRRTVGTALYPFESVAQFPRDAWGRVTGFFTDQTALATEVERMRVERLELARGTQIAEQLANENAQLRRLLDARTRLTVGAWHTQVLYEARDPFSQKIIIDRGSNAGARTGMPVVDDVGVVGQIVRVFPLTSEVALLTDRDQAIPVQISRNGTRAIAYGGERAGTVELRFLPSNVDVKEGDTLVTSGLDGLYPAGLPVARVVTVERGASAFARIVCEPLAGTTRHAHLLVLGNDADFPERPPSAVDAPRKGKPRGTGPRQ
ncbi:rod shape-determining protein MreC [soil metagenome]